MVPEIFRHGQAGQRHPHSGSRRFVHLSENHGGLLQHPGFRHFTVQVIALPGPFSDAGENRDAVPLGGDIMDQFLNQNCFPDPGAAEQTDFSALRVRRNQIDDLDAGLENLCFRVLILEVRRLPVYGPFFPGLHRTLPVNRVSGDVEQPSQHFVPHRHPDRCSGIHSFHASGQPVRGGQGDTPDLVVPLVLGNFRHDFFALVVRDLDGIQKFRQFSSLEFHIDDRPDDLMNFSFVHGHSSFYFIASAPETISMISSVIRLCRTRL